MRILLGLAVPALTSGSTETSSRRKFGSFLNRPKTRATGEWWLATPPSSQGEKPGRVKPSFKKSDVVRPSDRKLSMVQESVEMWPHVVAEYEYSGESKRYVPAANKFTLVCVRGQEIVLTRKRVDLSRLTSESGDRVANTGPATKRKLAEEFWKWKCENNPPVVKAGVHMRYDEKVNFIHPGLVGCPWKLWRGQETPKVVVQKVGIDGVDEVPQDIPKEDNWKFDLDKAIKKCREEEYSSKTDKMVAKANNALGRANKDKSNQRYVVY